MGFRMNKTEAKLYTVLPRYLAKEWQFPRKKRRGTMRRKRRRLREHPDWKVY